MVRASADLSTIEISDNFIDAYKQWKGNGITAVKAMELSGFSKATFYRKVKEYEAKKG